LLYWNIDFFLPLEPVFCRLHGVVHSWVYLLYRREFYFVQAMLCYMMEDDTEKKSGGYDSPPFINRTSPIAAPAATPPTSVRGGM
jgi:hypothetical protein